MRKIVVSGIKMPVSHSLKDVFEAALKAASECKIQASNPCIYKKSLDARRKNDIHFVYSVVLEAEDIENKTFTQNVRVFEGEKALPLINCAKKDVHILVVGSGPAGLFAAFRLTQCGMNVTVIERGSSIEKRQQEVKKFWETGILNPECNIQFGEGGAGTFSDGKLNTGISSPFQRFILKTFVENGAPEEILYQAKPHIGTDILNVCVKNIREKIKMMGGTVLFDTCLTDLVVSDGEVTGAVLDHSNFIACDALVLALGHSSRDTYAMLADKSVLMEKKPFAAGVRIEHKREFINKMQYGDLYNSPFLPTADYKLVHNGEKRSIYSFCMCPGGVVVNASSESGGLCVNGMSEHARMADNSNAALVVTVKPDDFDGDSPLAGVEFQRKYERAAYDLAKGKGPVQLSKDFVRDRVSDRFDGVIPSFTGKTEFVVLRECLPRFIVDTIKEGLNVFEKKIKGFSDGGSVLTGIEMRTSAPLRIKRDENFQSVSHKRLFPCGEGAGYAGGIMSAAVDGIRVAEKILEMNSKM